MFSTKGWERLFLFIHFCALCAESVFWFIGSKEHFRIAAKWYLEPRKFFPEKQGKPALKHGNPPWPLDGYDEFIAMSSTKLSPFRALMGEYG